MKENKRSETSLSTIIAPSFHTLYRDVKDEAHMEYFLGGGRGSCKSSFVSIMIILGMMRNKNANAVALKKVKETLRESVFEQLLWAIDILGVTSYWDSCVSPMRITYLPTGQKILFRGVDNPKKVRSGKLARGYFKYIWYEELDEFCGMEEIRVVNQTFMRGGEKPQVFYSYNPPRSTSSWVNMEVLVSKESRLYHASDYLSVPRAWLGEAFILEAEHLRSVNLPAYQHEYLGDVVGTGGEIFHNVSVRAISDGEIAQFDALRRGLDWGYAVDPFAYAVLHYDASHRRLYIFFEIYKVGLSNRGAAELLLSENTANDWICADSSEPKSIDELRSYGLRVRGARKGPGSIEFGIKFLCSLEEIIIDPVRCPCAVREFLNYELARSRSGEWISKYPDVDNHIIDAVRYCLEEDMHYNKSKFFNVK